jgi:hypothetical protein
MLSLLSLPVALVVLSRRAASAGVARTITTVKPTILGGDSADLIDAGCNALSEAV